MLSGIILAGGKGTRMGGRNKALLTLNGKTLLEYQLAVMERVCEDILVVANDAAPFAGKTGACVRIVPDVFPERGPLGGMHSAFSHVRNEAVWVVGCDMPFLSAEAALTMSDIWENEHADAVIPSDGTMLHPLHGIYAKRTRFSLETSIMQNRLSIQKWLSSLNTVIVDFSARWSAAQLAPPFWTNVNTPEDYAQARNNIR